MNNVTFYFLIGLLQADIDGARGNQAHKDMILSLKWVRQNIASFGGDPSRTVVFGESSGGTSIALLVMSNMTSGKTIIGIQTLYSYLIDNEKNF